MVARCVSLERMGHQWSSVEAQSPDRHPTGGPVNHLQGWNHLSDALSSITFSFELVLERSITADMLITKNRPSLRDSRRSSVN